MLVMRYFLLAAICLCPVACSRSSNPAVAQFTPAPDGKPEQARKLSTKRMKQLSVAVLAFAKNHEEKLPDLSSTEAFYKEVSAFLPSGAGNEIFLHPVTGEPYATNTGEEFSQHMTNGWTTDTFFGTLDASAVVIVYEAEAASDGTRGVIFMNGNVRRVSESQWETIKQASQIS